MTAPDRPNTTGRLHSLAQAINPAAAAAPAAQERERTGPLSNDELRKLKARQLAPFAEALQLYRQGRFTDAKTAFLQLTVENQHDKTLQLYLQRIERNIQYPPKEWLGFEVLTEK